jgi:predicted TIM-barrel fold metal-dependent hydrolase
MPTNLLKKIYVDTSGVSSVSILNCAIEVFTTNNILWGSDYPANREAIKSLEMVRGLSSGGEDILGTNLAKLLLE